MSKAKLDWALFEKAAAAVKQAEDVPISFDELTQRARNRRVNKWDWSRPPIGGWPERPSFSDASGTPGQIDIPYDYLTGESIRDNQYLGNRGGDSKIRRTDLDGDLLEQLKNMPKHLMPQNQTVRGIGGGNLSMGRQELNPATGKSRKFDRKLPKLPGPPMPGDVN